MLDRITTTLVNVALLDARFNRVLTSVNLRTHLILALLLPIANLKASVQSAL